MEGVAISNREYVMRLKADACYYRDAEIQGIDDLSPRHQDILGRLAEGKSNPEIADELFISPNTVKHHITAIYEALRLPQKPHSAGNRVLAARWWWERTL